MMAKEQKLSLFEALFINVTIMIGTGLFVNTVTFAQKIGSLIVIEYLITAFLMLPLVFSLTELIKRYPSGSFYHYAHDNINPIAGFLSSWIYFFGKLGSVTTGIHVFVSFMQQLFIPLKNYNSFCLDLGIITLFVLLNSCNIKTGSRIIKTFFYLKMMPIVFVFVCGFLQGTTTNITSLSTEWPNFLGVMPLVIFSLLGFEASCSLSRKIENPEKNAARALFASFGIVVVISIAYQLIFYSNLGTQFLSFIDYRSPFPALFEAMLPHYPTLQWYGYTLIHAAIASSALSGSYGMMYSLIWNFTDLVSYDHVPLKSYFSQINRHAIPYGIVILEGIMCVAYLLVTSGDILVLQKLAAFGCSITYALSCLALGYCGIKHCNKQATFLGMTGFASSFLLMIICGYGLIINGCNTIVLFSCITAVGLILFLRCKKKKNCYN